MKLTNPEIRIETTNKCNAHCIMCPREKMTREIGVMNLPLFNEILDGISSYGVTNLFLGGYGEALLDPHIVERVKAGKKRGFFTNFISNGSLMTEDMAKRLIDAGLDEIRFSFYGSTKQVYESVHRGLSFDVTKRNIERLIKLRNGLGKQTPKVYVFFLALEENAHQIEDFKKMWGSVVDAIEVWRPHNFGDGREYRKTYENKKSCGRPKVGPVQVQWDGTLIPCCWDYNGCMLLGDLKENTLEEILKGEKYEHIRNAHEKGEFGDYPFCDNCDQLNSKEGALVYSSRHNMDPDEAVKLTNSSLFSLK